MEASTANPAKRRRYRRHFLDKVIAKIDFAAPVVLPKAGLPLALKEAIKKRFPVAEPKKQVVRTVGFKFEDKVGALKDQETEQETTQWWFWSTERHKHLRLTESDFILQFDRYTDYEELRTDFLAIADAMSAVWRGTEARRLGLRYIDRVEIPDGQPTNWEGYFRKEVLGIFALTTNHAAISRAIHWLEFNYGDTALRFQYGMSNPDYPAPIRRRLFILDHDAYSTILLRFDELQPYLDRFHEQVNESFESVITEKLREIMEPVNGEV